MDFNIEDLLSPITEDQPCGVDCSFSHEFQAIKKAKMQDDPLLAQGEWLAEHKQADWAFVENKSIELLTKHSKDIRLYHWLLEAWSHNLGFAGIAQGLELVHQSLHRYWDFLHPEIEENDLDQRLGLIQGLINQIPLLIKGVNLVSGASTYSLQDYEMFLHQQNLRRRRSEDEVELENISDNQNFEQLIAHTSIQVKQTNTQHFQVILQQWQSLKNVLDELIGVDAPSFAHVDSQLDDISKQIQRIYKHNPVDPAQSITVNQSTSIDCKETRLVQMPSSFEYISSNHLQNRANAIRLLNEIAKYFAQNEPHSPVSYMLQKTVRWSEMPLHEWLAQVIKNEQPLEQIQELLGANAQIYKNNEW